MNILTVLPTLCKHVVFPSLVVVRYENRRDDIFYNIRFEILLVHGTCERAFI